MCRWYHVYHVHVQNTYSAQRDSSKWLCFEWTETDRNYSIQPCLEYVSAEYSMLNTHSLVKRLCLFGVYTTTNLTSDPPPLEITISPDLAEQDRDQISIQTSPLINSTSSGAWRNNMEFGVWRSEWFVHHLTAIIAVSGVLSRENGSWDMALHVYQGYSVQISLRHGVSLEPAECEPWTDVIPRLLSRWFLVHVGELILQDVSSETPPQELYLHATLLQFRRLWNMSYGAGVKMYGVVVE